MRKQHLRARIDKLEQKVEAQKAISSLPSMKVDKEVLDHELMRLVVELDPKKHPGMKLKAIEAAYVVNGTLESKGTRRLSPPDAGRPGVYQSLFERLGQVDNTPPADLYPPGQEKPTLVASDTPFPPLGELIDEAPMSDKSKSRIFTVDVDELVKTFAKRPQ
jgi:hypothetical protein